MMRMIRLAPLLGLLLLAASMAAGQTARVEVSSNEVAVGGSLTYTVRTSGYVQISGEPRTTSDTIAMEQSRQTERRFINGQQEEAHTWRFTGVKEGAFVIHPPRVSINGDVQQLDNVNGRVTAAAQLDTSALGRVGLIEGDEAARARYQDRYFTTAEASNETPYAGEVFFVTTYAHWRAGYESPRMARPRVNRLMNSPAFVFPGLRTARFYNASLASNHLVMIDGARFFRQATHTVPVVAIRSGRHEVESIGVDLQFGFNAIPFELPATEVEVQALPARLDGTVARFVGRPTMSLFPDREEVKQGELISVTLRVSGEGYWEAVDLDDLPEVPGLRLVDREVSFRIDSFNQPFVSTKEYYLVYQVTEAGSHLFPDLEFSVFDTESEEMERVEVQGFEFFAERSEGTTYALRPDGSTVDNPIHRGEARELGGEGLLYIDTGALSSRTYDATARPIGLRAGYWAAHGAPLLLLGAGALFVSYRRRRDADPVEQRRRELRETTKGELDKAMHALAAQDVSDFYASLAGGLEAAVALRIGQAASGLTREDLGAGLRGADVTPADATAVVRLLERCDGMRYAPEPSAGAMQDDLGEAERLVGMLAPVRRKGGG